MLPFRRARFSGSRRSRAGLTQRPRNRIQAILVVAAVVGLGACGGHSGTAPKTTTCADDPTLPGCTTPPPAAGNTLDTAAAVKGRYFGTAVDTLFLAGANAAYFATLAREFSELTPGNVLKWGVLNRDSRFTYRYSFGDSVVSYAATHGMKVRGHTLVWHQQNPTWLTSATWSPDTLTAILLEHIANVVGHYKGKLYAWDVVNEALNDDGTRRSTIWAAGLGPTYIETAFRAARAADSSALLFYNDYNLEFTGPKQDSAYSLLADFKARGVPVDGIGFQAHFQINADGSGVPSRTALTATFQRFAALGLKNHITELDVRVRTPGATAAELTAQSNAYGDIVAACLAVSACDTIVVWGLTDAESWVPSTFPGYGSALLFDNSHGKKATYYAVLSALKQ
ncbi:MAG: endo-1,4-beta-xylanase [Gemmatimonadales bacterium]